MSLDLAVTETQIERIISRAPYAYKLYTIPKRSGGERVIAQPAKETKYLQRWLVETVFSKLPVHSSATAYRLGASIKRNAEVHKAQSYLAKFDFSDFFTSISYDDLTKHFTTHLAVYLSLDEIEDAARLSCIQLGSKRGLCLSIGAPSSPILSNSVLFQFDTSIADWCLSRGVSYTRYADDLTFSTNEPGVTVEIETFLVGVLGQLAYPKLNLNSKKTIHLSKRHRRQITGVVVSNSGELSIGRPKKREIASLIHRYQLSQLEQSEIPRLQGLLGFSKDIEPIFVTRMRKKYGSTLISEILRHR